jgi:hypothetical protein
MDTNSGMREAHWKKERTGVLEKNTGVVHHAQNTRFFLLLPAAFVFVLCAVGIRGRAR